MTYGKLINGVLVFPPDYMIINNVKYKPVPEWVLKEQNWKEVEYTVMPIPKEGWHYISSWEEGPLSIVQTWILVEDSPAQTVEKLKAELDSTDYKIIKCSEYLLAGKELPYDIDELHTARQALRDKINELEN